MVFISFSRILPSRLPYNILKNKKFDEKDKGGRGNINRIVEDLIKYIVISLFILFYFIYILCVSLYY